VIEPSWKRIAGFHLEEDGTLGAVWLAHDDVTGVVHLYDAALFTREVPAVICEGLAARGRHFPMAWRKKDAAMSEKLDEAGLYMLADPCADDQSMSEVISRDIWQRLRTGQFRVERRVGEWLEEYRKFYREGQAIPKAGFPLMAATRHAIEMLPYAQAEFGATKHSNNYPEMSIV